MPDATYVEIGGFTAKGKIYDDKATKPALDAMTNAAKAAVKGQKKLDLDAKPAKGTKGWCLLGNLVALGPDSGGKSFVAKVSALVATWPDKSIKATLSGEGSFAIEPGEKVSAGDAVLAVKKASEDAFKLAVGHMASKKPE